MLSRIRERLFSQHHFEPTDDPEVQELADRVAHLEGVSEDQDERLSVVEAKVGVRSRVRWPGSVRDAG